DPVLPQLLQHEPSSDVVAEVPAIVVRSADQHESRLHLLLRESPAANERKSRRGSADLENAAAVESDHLLLLRSFSDCLPGRASAGGHEGLAEASRCARAARPPQRD